MIEVKAIAKGYFGNPGEKHKFIEVGTKFILENEKLFSSEWMERLTPLPSKAPQGCKPDEPTVSAPPETRVKRKYTRKVV